MNIMTDFGVEVTVHGGNMRVHIRVPYKKYFDKVEGACGHIVYDSDRDACKEN